MEFYTSALTDYKMLMLLFLSLWFNLTLGGGKSSDQKSSVSLGSYKTLEISASPEYSAKYKKPSKGDPVDMAYEFLELNRGRLGIENPREELKQTYKALDSISGVVTFQQVCKGVPILYSNIAVRFTGTGELKSVEGDYHYDINLPTTPSIDSASAVSVALQAMSSPAHPKVVGPGKPVIVSSKIFRPIKEDRLYLVYIVEIFPDSTKRLDKFERYYVDALSGTILYHEWSSILRG